MSNNDNSGMRTVFGHPSAVQSLKVGSIKGHNGAAGIGCKRELVVVGLPAISCLIREQAINTILTLESH